MKVDLKRIAKERASLNETIRSFFSARGYVEVETPILVRSPGMEPNLTPFETCLIDHKGQRHVAGLITSPEYSMKKLLGSGMEKIFSLARVFRNEEHWGGLHNPEFTLVEWYRAGADYHACMDETEELVRCAAKAFGHPLAEREFERMTVGEAFQNSGIDMPEIGRVTSVGGPPTERNAVSTGGGDRRQDPPPATLDSLSDTFFRIFLEKVEPALRDRVVFLHDYPFYQAALARMRPDGKTAERFELYVDGVELCNGFTELTDACQQRTRFEQEAAERAAAGKTVFAVDENLLALLPSIPQPTYGNALGVDRLHMLVTGRSRIEEVLLFPASDVFSATQPFSH